jgi:CBS domain-containing membrane protein
MVRRVVLPGVSPTRFPPRRRGANRARFGLHARLIDRFGVRGDAVYILLAAGLTTAVAGVAAMVLHRPLIFPSIGPTVFVLFESPMEPEASPRNTLLGHGAALVIGYATVSAFGLAHTAFVFRGLSASRAAAAAVSVGLTEALLVFLRAPHPPAGATALIVSLGLLATPVDLLSLALGVALVTAVAWALNRALGIPVPVWSPVPEP